MVEFYLGTKQTGIYYFFSNISMLIETFVQTTVVMIYSPKLIASLKKDKPFQIDIFKTFSKEIIIYSVLAVVSVCAIIYPLLHVVEKTELSFHQRVLCNGYHTLYFQYFIDLSL